MNNIWENAPPEATHYQPAEFEHENEVYFKITHWYVESAWVPVSEENEFDFPIEGDYYRIDYTWDKQPVVRWESLIAKVPDAPKIQPTSLAKWLLDKAGSGMSYLELGFLTMPEALQIIRELEEEDKYHCFAITVYSDDSAYVTRRNYYGDEDGDKDQYIFGFTFKEETK